MASIAKPVKPIALDAMLCCTRVNHKHSFSGRVLYSQAAMMVYFYCLSAVIFEQLWQKSIPA